jgi:N-alpha-acetyltransferase 50
VVVSLVDVLCAIVLWLTFVSHSFLSDFQLRKVNLACFPVQYQETYYKDVVERHDEGLCKFAYWNGFVVGAACARLEDLPEEKEEAVKEDSSNKKKKDASSPTKKRIYIMTLGVLAAYRGMEIGTQLIQSIFDHYEENKENDEYKDVVEISLHVQISNDDAIKFYITRFGFEKGELVENYYRRIDPPHCYKLYKKLK